MLGGQQAFTPPPLLFALVLCWPTFSPPPPPIATASGVGRRAVDLGGGRPTPVVPPSRSCFGDTSPICPPNKPPNKRLPTRALPPQDSKIIFMVGCLVWSCEQLRSARRSLWSSVASLWHHSLVAASCRCAPHARLWRCCSVARGKAIIDHGVKLRGVSGWFY